MAIQDITKIPAPRTPIADEVSGEVTAAWYRFFYTIYTLSGSGGTGGVPVNRGGTGLTTIGNHQLIIGNTSNVFEPTELVGSGITITYGAGTVTLAIGNSGVTPGTYGNAASVGQFTVDIYGTLVFAQNVPIAIDANQITSGTLVTARGGTGLSSFVANQLFYAGSTSTIDQSNKLLFDGNVLTSTGGIGGGNF